MQPSFFATIASTGARRLIATLTAFSTAIAPLSPALVAATLMAPLTAGPAVAYDDSVVNVGYGQRRVNLGLNKSKVIVLSAPAHDVLVANPQVADAVTRTARRIYIFGKNVGDTNLIVFDNNDRQIASINVSVERDLSGLDGTIRKYVPSAEVQVDIINDNIVLTGRVLTPQDSETVARLARLYVTGGEATTGQYIQQASAPGGQGGNGDVAFASEDRRQSNIVNLLEIAGEDQVTLKVTVAEVQRSVVKQLGLNGSISGSGDSGIAYLNSDNPFGLGKAIADSAIGGAGSFGDFDITGQLNAMEQAGVMRTLAEPNLTAVSGEKASFKVGGEYSIPDGRSFIPPERSEEGNVLTDGYAVYEQREVEYGIGLDFTPVVLGPGRINLKIRTSVSEPSFESPFNISGDEFGPGTGILGIRKRLADTTVELPSGGSLVIAGLVRDEVRQVISGFPGLSKIPVLGTLFRSRDFQRYETELVVIVTPYLAKPTHRDNLARPDDGLAFSSDGSANFLGRVNRVYGQAKTDLPDGRYHGVVGFIYK